MRTKEYSIHFIHNVGEKMSFILIIEKGLEIFVFADKDFRPVFAVPDVSSFFCIATSTSRIFFDERERQNSILGHCRQGSGRK
mgnify:CR=1 FL=1